jgi:hypothetical protein
VEIPIDLVRCADDEYVRAYDDLIEGKKIRIGGDMGVGAEDFAATESENALQLV